MRIALIVLVIVIGALAALFVIRNDGQLAGRTPAEEVVEEAAEAPAEAPAMALPRFDIVRVDRQGFAVVAGRGMPGTTIELLANGAVIAEEQVEADGAWAISVDTPLDAGPVELTLRQTGEDGVPITSEETIVIYVPEDEGDAPVVLRTTPGGATEVLQRATDPVEGLGPLAVETIDYDAAGGVIFAGRATPGAAVQLFLDGQPVGPRTTASPEGRWTVETEVPPGRYVLRAVQIGEDGLPAYVVEVPFERAGFADIQRTDGGVVVQPGNSLWVISRAVYGEGRQYTIIFAANMDQIRDPDLIYPGQVFTVPEDPEGGEEDGDRE